MESVDKFGRTLWSGRGSSGGVGMRGPRGEGFVLDENGHYLVSNKQIKQLANPEDNSDAVNKQWAESKIKPIDERLKVLEDEKPVMFNYFLQALDQSTKAYDKSMAGENTLRDLANRVRALEEDRVKRSLEQSVSNQHVA